MSKKKKDTKNEVFNFRAENKPYYVISEREILNQNVDWKLTLEQIIATEVLTYEQIAEKCETTTRCLNHVLMNDTSLLRFRTGACMLALYTTLVGDNT